MANRPENGRARGQEHAGCWLRYRLASGLLAKVIADGIQITQINDAVKRIGVPRGPLAGLAEVISHEIQVG